MLSQFAHYPRISKTVRAAANLSGTPYPIEAVDGFGAPKLAGKSYYHVTQGGTVVRYPNAYRRKAKSARLIYVGSTLRIVVGKGWLIEQGLV